ncbi:hypothetical protein ACA910_000058 [Epithemia clementina (nom. ined.)]
MVKTMVLPAVWLEHAQASSSATLRPVPMSRRRGALGMVGWIVLLCGFSGAATDGAFVVHHHSFHKSIILSPLTHREVTPTKITTGRKATIHLYSTSSSSNQSNDTNKKKPKKKLNVEGDVEEIKKQLLEYLEKRKELGADELAQKEVGKIIGGTKGNVVLDFVSGAPNKEQVLDQAPNALDYSELVKYGYGHLATPIMKLGGRYAMYELLNLEAPAIPATKRVTAPTKIIIDRTGESDPNRYTGLKLGQVLDDALQAQVLEQARQNQKQQQSQSSSLLSSSSGEDAYEIPFSDKRNVGPRQTPDWTPERLDEWGKAQGRVEAWARKAKAGEFVSDPNETLDALTWPQRLFSIVTALLVSTAFGKATTPFLVQVAGIVPDETAATALEQVFQGPAIGLLLASLVSMVYSFLQSKELNRNPWIWSIKGWLGGPLTISLLRTLEPLITRSQQDEKDKRLQKSRNDNNQM